MIDTAGMNPSDERVTKQMTVLSNYLQSIEKVLVLPATSHYQVLIDAIKRYQANHVDQCIITKLDESLAVGGAISAVIESNLALGYLTDGQRVPEDIKIATRHQLVELFAQQELQLFQEARDISKINPNVRRENYVEA